MKEHLVYSILDVVRKDLATSAGTDMVPEYHYAQLAKQMQSGHWAFEVGLKTLIEKSQGEYKWTHDLLKLYFKLRSVNPQAFSDLDNVYRDTVNFYRLTELEDDLAGYLARVGKKEVFERLRYAALNRAQVAFRDVPLSQVYFELLAVLRDYEEIGLRARHFPSRRIAQQVEAAVVRAMTSDPEEFERRKDAWTWLCNLQETGDVSWRTLLHRAYQRDFRLEGAQSDRVELLLRKALETLTSRGQNSGVNFDPALDYYLSRIKYVPSGAEQNKGTPEPVLSGRGENDVIAQVSSPSGVSLGLIEKLQDGAWLARPQMTQGFAFEKKEDAALYVVRVKTRILRASLGQHQHKDVRIVHDMDHIEWPIEAVGDDWRLPAGPHDATLTFWDECPFEVGDSLDAALLPFDDEDKSVLRINAQVISQTERKCVIRGSWV